LVNGDIDALNDYCQQAFGDGVGIGNTEYPVISPETALPAWDDRFAGDVALQVTGTLQSTD
jgi:hypothetical protein